MEKSLTIGVSGEKILQLLLTGGELDAADPNAESRAGSLSLLGYTAKEPGYGAGYGAEGMTGFRGSQHCMRFSCKT